MLSKHPLEVPPGRKLSKDEVVEALRLSIIAELDAINLYLQLARAVEDERVRKVFEDIAREEKTHVGEFLALLKDLDPEQVEELARGEKEVRELSGGGARSPGQESPNSVSAKGSGNGFEEVVAKEVKRLADSARAVAKRLPVTMVGRGVDAVPLERLGEGRAVLPLCEIGYRFRVSQKAVDYASRWGQVVEMPEAVKAALALVAEEDRLVVEALVKEGKTRLQLGSWDDPGASVIDVAKAVSELSKQGLRRPYVLIVSPARYAKLLSVSEKTGVTDLERVKMLVDEVVVSHSLPDDTVVLLSATYEVLDVVYGGNAEVDYIGPEDGYQAFRVWSSIAVRLRIPTGVAVMRSGEK